MRQRQSPFRYNSARKSQELPTGEYAIVTTLRSTLRDSWVKLLYVSTWVLLTVLTFILVVMGVLITVTVEVAYRLNQLKHAICCFQKRTE